MGRVREELHAGLEVQVVEVASREVGRTDDQRGVIGAPVQQQLRMALLAVGVAPAHVDAGRDEFTRGLPVRNAVLLASERIFVRVEQDAQRDAA